MNLGFWGRLPRPFLAQAPMLDVTDAAFRRIIAKYGKPDVMFTEFVSADGLCSRGRGKLLPMLWFTEAERPIVAQIFSADPGKIREASALVSELGFDGVDLNMGCPDRNVMKQGSGAALIKDPARAREIIRAAKEGAESAGRRMPVSVKTRTGDRSDSEIEAWIPDILAEEPAALTVHARTRADMSKVPARWETVRRAVELRDAAGVATRIVGNGDVPDAQAALARAAETGCDGIMIGRAMFGNPWVFAGLVRAERGNQTEHPAIGGAATPYTPTTKEKLQVLVEHAKLFEELYGTRKFDVMKKHLNAYVNGFPGAMEVRVKLMGTVDVTGVREILDMFLEENIRGNPSQMAQG